MTTSHLQEALTAYLSGELVGSERAAVEEHLAQCAECRLQLDRLKALNTMLGDEPSLEPSTDFVARVMQQADREKRPVRFPSRRILAWVALAAAIAFVVFLLRYSQNAAPQPGPVAKKPPAQGKPPESPVAPPVTAQDETIPPPPPQKIPETSAPNAQLSAEDAELIAHLDELEEMELINNYDSLQELDTALLATQGEQVR